MIYPVDSDGYPPFEQLGPGVLTINARPVWIY